MAAIQRQERKQVDHREDQGQKSQEDQRVGRPRHDRFMRACVMPTMLDISPRALELVSACAKPVRVCVVTCHISLSEAPAAPSAVNSWGAEAEADQHAPRFLAVAGVHRQRQRRPALRIVSRTGVAARHLGQGAGAPVGCDRAREATVAGRPSTATM